MKILSRLSLVLVALLSTISSWAQVSFTADAPSPIGKGERFNVSFVVDAEPDRDSFKSPSFEGFEILAGPATSTGQSISYVNGVKTSSYTRTYTYTLIARESGSFKIDKASIKVNGKEYKTNTLLIEVVEGDYNATVTPDSGVDKGSLFIRWVVSDGDVYVGEAVRASLVLYYYDTNVSSFVNYASPTFDNFWSNKVEIDDRNRASRDKYNGRVYNTYKIDEYLLVPPASGDFELPQVSLDVIVRVEVASYPNDIFFGSYWDEKAIPCSTAPMTIKVKDFPEGAPVSFNGAVGRFQMECQTPDKDININSAGEVQITISGNGNLQFITAPKLTFPQSFELYDPTIKDNIYNSLSGSVTYTYPFVARAAGEFDIDAFEFSFFNPSTGEYETLRHDPFTITVVNNGSTARSYKYRSSGYGNDSNIEKDIRYIKQEKLVAESGSMLLFSSTYWIIIVAIIALFVAVFVIMRQRIRANKNVVARRMKHADKVAIQRLRLANKSMKENNRHSFYKEILNAMWGYVSDKFNIPVSNLTKERIREELSHRGVSTEDSEQLCDIISRADEAQYAPMAEDDMMEVYASAVEVISKIESVVKH